MLRSCRVTDRLELNSARGYHEPNLEFLYSWPVRWLNVPAPTIRDIEPSRSIRDDH
jgi:hypothetical protein